jgi:hypothetical protein
MSQLLAYATSNASTKPIKRKGMDAVAFALPSLRTKDLRLFEVFSIEVIAKGLRGHHGPFTNQNIIEIVVFFGDAKEHSIDRPIHTRCLKLDPVNIGQFL